MNGQQDQNPGLLVILLLGILSVHQLLPGEEGDVHVPHQHPFIHLALGSFEPRDMWLTELIVCVLAVTLHRTVVFYWIEKITVVTILGTLVTWDQGGGGGGNQACLRSLAWHCNTALHSFCPTPTATSWWRGWRCQCSSSNNLFFIREISSCNNPILA